MARSPRSVFALVVLFALGGPGCGPTLIDQPDGGPVTYDTPPTPDAPSFGDSGIGRSDLAIDRVVPDHGSFAGGTIAILRGAGFTNESNVTFGEHAVQPADHTLIDSRRLSVVVPAGEVGTVDVSIEVGGETFTLPDAYTYDALNVSPSSGSIAGNTFITITGRGTAFVTGDTVTVGRGDCIDVQVLSPTSITCRTPPAAAGSVDVTVTRLADGSETVAADAFNYYDSSDPIGGGLGGGPMNGDLNITVLNWITGEPVADVFAIVGEDLSTEHQGLTNALGQISFSGPDLVGAHTVHLSKTCYERTSVVAFDATDATVFLLPWLEPDPRCPGDGGMTGGGRGRRGAFIQGQLVWRGPNEYGPNPWANIPEPRDEWIRVAYVFTTVAETDVPNPDPGAGGSAHRILEDVPEGDGWIGYPYQIFARPSGLAVYALAGLELPAAPPGRPTARFVPYVMGVARNVLAGPGETEANVNLVMDIPLDHYVEATPGTLPPDIDGDPDHFRFGAYMDLGGEGLIVRNVHDQDFDVVRRPDVSGGIRFVGEPALRGAIEDARYRITGGWFTGLTYESTYEPETVVVVNGVTAVDDAIELPDFLGIPDATSPASGDFIPADRILRWERGGTEPADFHVIRIAGVRHAEWRMFVPGDVFEAPIPDLSEITDIEDMPEGYLVWDITAVRVPGLDFDEFRYTYLNDRYWTHSSHNQFDTEL